MKPKISFALIVALIGVHTLSFSLIHATGITPNILKIEQTVPVSDNGDNCSDACSTAPVPNSSELGSSIQVVTQVVTQSQLVQTIYQKVLALPAQSSHKICPLYLTAEYHLTFQQDSLPLLKANAQQGGCSTITLGRSDIRAADPSFWEFFNATIETNIASNGLVPGDLQGAYGLPSATTGKGQLVAIVDAYDDPNAEADMNVYRSTYNLPLCTTLNGCFKKVDEVGGTHYPDADQGWAEEIALDLDMVSAICPNCHILLVEAKDASFSNLGSAVDTAIRLGAHIVNNSYGSPEDAQAVLSAARYYNHPGVIITASSGDFGSDSGVQLPAAFHGVVAVGGTSLFPDPSASQNTRGWTETAWDGAGGGCSKYVNQPAWQRVGGCGMRNVPDVSAVADPDTGVAVYNTYGGNAWGMAGGTSASSAIIAGVYGLAGNAAKIDGSYLYSHTANLYKAADRGNGDCNSTSASIHPEKCKKESSQRLAGLGTPNGIDAF